MKVSAMSWIVLFITVLNFLSCSYSVENYRVIYPKRMASYIDNTVSPCADFFQYACGNYNRALRKEKFDFIFTARNQIAHFMHDILMEPLNTTVVKFSAEDKAKMFYQSCMKVDHFKYTKSEAFLGLLNLAGGWPAINQKWNITYFDWFQFELLAAKFGANIFIFEGLTNNRKKIYLTAGRFYLKNKINFLLPYSRQFQLAKGVTMHIMKMYGISNSTAKRTWNEIIEFGKLWKRFQTSYKWIEQIETINSSEDLMKIIPNVDWKKYIEVLFGSYPTLESDLLKIKNLHSMNNIEQFIKENKRAAANYAAISFLLQVHTELNAERSNQQFCYNQVSSYLRPIEGALFLARNPEERRIENEIRTMVDYIRNSYRNNIKKADWLSREIKQKLITKINMIYVKFPEELHPINFEALNEEYKNLKVSPQNDYYENVLAVRSFRQQRKHLKFLHNKTIEDKNLLEVNAFYNYKSNSIGLLAGIIQKPFYFPGFPPAYNFGGVGTVIAHEFGHALDPNYVIYDELGKTFTWDDLSQDGFSQRKLCFLNHYNAIPAKELYPRHNASISIGENIANCLSIRQAYFAYQSWMKMFRSSLDMTKQTLPGLNLTSDQLFFLSYGQQYCTTLTRKEVVVSQKEEHGPNRIALVGSVSNFHEFSRAFNCDLKAPMNPEEKCTLF